MKRTLLSLFLALCLLLSLSATASAQGTFVIDEAGLLTETEESDLTEKAAALSKAYGMDIVILTNQSLGGKSPETFADDYYDTHGYSDDGILFLLSMEERDWYISTCGSGIYALTDYGIQKLGESLLPALGDGRYFEAFDQYLNSLEFYLESYQAGSPIDGRADTSGDFYTGTRENVVHYRNSASFGSRLWKALWQSLILGLVAAAVTVSIMRANMNTKNKQAAASAYLKVGSFHLHQHRDLFLYSRVNKTRRQESSSSGGGGSSVHHSSSGRSHGGGGGKF